MLKPFRSFAIQQAYNQVHNDIINGVLKPGEQLSATLFNEQLKIEPVLAQEVLCHLMYSGLITANNDSTFCIITITEYMVRDICITLLQIEEIAITQSLANGDDKWEAEIHRTLLDLDNALNQQPDFLSLLVERNESFHNAIVASCNSIALLQIRAHLYHKFNTLVQIYIKNIPSKAILMQKQEEHKMIAQAALNRDAKKTCLLNYYHIINSVKIVVDAINKSNT